MSHEMMTPQVFFCYKSYNNIGCDDDDEEEVDSDDMELPNIMWTCQLCIR
jgi:hypothetical protein